MGKNAASYHSIEQWKDKCNALKSSVVELIKLQQSGAHPAIIRHQLEKIDELYKQLIKIK